jgi:hypothetical protein
VKHPERIAAGHTKNTAPVVDVSSTLVVAAASLVAEPDLGAPLDGVPTDASPHAVEGSVLSESGAETHAASVFLDGLPEGVSGYWDPRRRSRRTAVGMQDLTPVEIEEARVQGYWQPREHRGRPEAVDLSGDEVPAHASGGYWDRGRTQGSD